jgi:hypothetical protein
MRGNRLGRSVTVVVTLSLLAGCSGGSKYRAVSSADAGAITASLGKVTAPGAVRNARCAPLGACFTEDSPLRSLTEPAARALIQSFSVTPTQLRCESGAPSPVPYNCLGLGDTGPYQVTITLMSLAPGVTSRVPPLNVTFTVIAVKR